MPTNSSQLHVLTLSSSARRCDRGLYSRTASRITLCAVHGGARAAHQTRPPKPHQRGLSNTATGIRATDRVFSGMVQVYN